MTGDECVAVGHALKWHKPIKRSEPFGPWRCGRTVWCIDLGPPCWTVTLDPNQEPDGWTNPILCGDRVEVEYLKPPEAPQSSLSAMRRPI